MLLVELLGVESRKASHWAASSLQPEAEALVELDVRPDAERGKLALDDLDAVEVDRVQVLLGRLPHRAVELLAPPAVGLVRHRPGGASGTGSGLAVDRHLELGLELGELLGVLARELAEVALAAELPELADAAVAVDRRADRLHVLELGQRRVPLVDLLELEPVLQARVVEVVLLVELGDEAVGLVAVGVELAGVGALGTGRRISGCERSAFGPSGGRSCSTSRRRSSRR